MKYAIQVNGHPETSRAAAHAYQFIKAAIAKDHEFVLVFFYYDGVFNGLVHAEAVVADAGKASGWAAVARAHGLNLVLCVSAAERRGLLAKPDDRSDRGQGLPRIAVAPGFRTGGLGLWVDACLRSDRWLVFSA